MRMMRRLLCWSAGLAMSAAVGMAAAADKPVITIGYVDGWSDSVATTHVAAEVIREKLGYEVKLMPVAAGIMWQGVARGKLDAMLSAWLPGTHGAYYEKMKDKVVNLAINYPDARIGLIVPEYVSANSIADLQAQKDAFGGRVVGIDAGAGVMIKTDEAIKQYGLDYKLVASSGSGMIAELTRAENEKKPVVVTGWIPHWMFAKWKLKFLDDPKKVYGDTEHVDTVANPALEAKAKPVWEFLKKFGWKDGNEVGQVMLAIQEGAKPEDAAKQWVAANPGRVKDWSAVARLVRSGNAVPGQPGTAFFLAEGWLRNLPEGREYRSRAAGETLRLKSSGALAPASYSGYRRHSASPRCEDKNNERQHLPAD